MQESKPVTGSLVLYRSGPALVTAVSDKIDISLPGGKRKRVRNKDIMLLHPGPLADLAELDQPVKDVQEAWELIAEESVNLAELAELVYGEYTPGSAWGTWLHVAKGLYFEGDPDRITGRERNRIEADIAEQQSRVAAERAWRALIDRLKKGNWVPEDREQLQEVERLALGRSQHSRILAAMDLRESPESAHRALIRMGYWAPHFNPYPLRAGVRMENPEMATGSLPDDQRLDLTHLAAYAIDDQDSNDPDDAISLDGERIWVHVADVAAMVPPDSALDAEARARGANLYLPEKIVHMLPPGLTEILGLGLSEVSPALSFGFRISPQASAMELEIVPSFVKVSRTSYAEVETRLMQEPFASLVAVARAYRQRRLQAGATDLSLPEARVRVTSRGEIEVKLLQRLESREMVAELMLMTGEAVAGYALMHEIPLPFTVQSAPELGSMPADLAGMYALRRQLKPSRQSTLEAPHSGLGLDVYTRTTSPLRRYMDLLTHQQLRAHLQGGSLLSREEISERIAAAESGGVAVRRAERISNLHWKLVHLQRNPGWRGKAVVVEKQQRRVSLLIPELALETRIQGANDLDLNREFEVVLKKVDIPDQMAWFKPF